MSLLKPHNLNPSVCSIIVTYNPDEEIFSRQLQSLIHQVTFIVVVDNNSTNIKGIIECIDRIRGLNVIDVHLITNTDNLGLGKAQNLGIKFAQSNDASHVLIMDQDSIVEGNFINGLLDSESYLEKNGVKVGAIGPIYYNELTGEIYPITKYSGPFIERISPTDQPVEATFLIASGCLISIEVIDVVGYMNEDLFIDYIDVEWCFRAKSLGFGVFASPLSKMMHTIGDNRASILGRSISVHSPLRRYYLYRNSIYMIKNKTIDTGYKLREVTFNILRLIVFLFLSKEKVKYFKYSMSGFIDGFKGKVGKCPHHY